MSDSAADVEAVGGPDRDAPARRRAELLGFAELFALSGIAIGQPLLDLLSKNTGIFVAHRSTGLEVIVLVALILFAIPFSGWVVELVAARILVPIRRTGHARRLVRRLVHALLGGALVVCLALEVVKRQTTLGSSAIIWVALGCGVVGAGLVLWVSLFRQFLHVLAVAPLVFGLLFLTSSAATSVVFSTTRASASKIGAKTPHRVVMVLLDEFPEMSILDGAGRVDRELFPNLAQFADESTWYRNETTVAPYTDFAVPAILSGRYPQRLSAKPVVGDYPDNLFTLLGKSYGMNVHESVTRLCPSDVCKGGGTGGGIGALVSESTHLWKEFASPKRSKFSFADDAGVGIALPTMQEFVQSLRPSKEPRLDFVHIVFPHQPWHFLPSLQDTVDPRLPGAETLAWGSQALADSGRMRHLLQAQAADVLVGRVVAKLKAIGAYDDSMVIVTADHGVAFTGRQPLRSVTQDNYPQILWPPLFVKYPKQATAKVDDRPAQTVDILPTVADVVGVKIPFRVDGRSLLGTPRAEGMRPFYSWQIPGGFPLAGGLVAPPGKHLDFDGGQGFRRVLAARAAPPGKVVSLRVYQAGKYGSLVGRMAAPLVHDVANGDQTVGVAKLAFQHVNPNAAKVPWAFQQGGVHRERGKLDLAIAVAGRVVAVAAAGPLIPGLSVNAFFVFSVPPELVPAGSSEVSVYIIRGTVARPSLDPLPIAAT